MNRYFKIACEEAKKAYKKNEIPVGAVIVCKNKVIAKAHNNRQHKFNILGHAEVLAIQKAERKIKDWRLNECTLYVTLEPCELCKKIIKESRIKEVIYLKKQTYKSENNELKIIQTNDCDKFFVQYDELFENFFLKLREK